MFVVVHLPSESPNVLADMLAKDTALRVVPVRDGMPVESGQVVFAPPDLHLVLEDSVVRLTRGPRENRHRPSIDVLFRSAAATYGERVIGVVLTGSLDDGSAGLWSIKRRGGLAIVQDPSEAEFPEMPRNAMEITEVDFALPVGDIATKLSELAGSPASGKGEAMPAETAHEVRMAAEGNSDIVELDQIGERTPFTCPECGGVLWELSGNGPTRLRCHVGHAYSMRTFAAEQTVRVEAALWAALRVLEENERLFRRLADEAKVHGRRQSAKFHHENARSTAAHADVVRNILAHSGVDNATPRRAPKPGKRR